MAACPSMLRSNTHALLGNLSEMMGDLDSAVQSYESAIRHNRYCITAMNQISAIYRTKENFPKAVEYLQEILKLDPNNGEVMGSLGVYCQVLRIMGSEATDSARPLLLDDGGPSASLQRIPECTVPPAGPKGRTLLRQLHANPLANCDLGTQTLVRHRYSL